MRTMQGVPLPFVSLFAVAALGWSDTNLMSIYEDSQLKNNMVLLLLSKLLLPNSVGALKVPMLIRLR